MKCGIYKITSPSGRIYIGQSRNIEDRFYRYKKMSNANKTQIRLMRSFKKYGVQNHNFEIVEECTIDVLNIKERYWQDHYKVISKSGLNCILQETDTLPRQFTEEYKRKRSGINHFFYGKHHSEETKKKLSLAHIGKTVPQYVKDKLKITNSGSNNGFYGKKHTEESKKKQSVSAKTRKITPENESKRRAGISKGLSKVLLQYDKQMNLIKEWPSVIIAAKELNTHVGSIVNATQMKRVKSHKGFIWKYKNI